MKYSITAKFLILIVIVAIPSALRAQTFLSTDWNQSSPAVTTGTDSNGTFLSTAATNSSITFNSTETSSSNPQFLWVPAYGALRAGIFWNSPSTTSMGQFSTAFGEGTMASGMASTAMGMGSSASNTGSTAIGYEDTASGSGSVALGMEAMAIGSGSFAVNTCYAGGSNSTAIGLYTTASATYSTAAGFETTANSYDSFVIGIGNVGKNENGGSPSSTTWISNAGAADPLYEIGNGTYTTPSDALVVYKDGNAVLQGSLKVAPSGDIPMFTGN